MFFDAVRNNKRVVQIFLALIALPFGFWGVDSYVRNTGAGSDVASVGDTKITVPQFEQAWRVYQERMRQALGASFKPETVNTSETRLAVVNSLIDQRLLLLEAAKNRLNVGDDQLREAIRSIPVWQENGQFSLARYQSLLAAQGLTQAQFEAQMRQDLILRQLVAAIGDTGIASQADVDEMLRLQAEQRQVAEFRFSPEQFFDQVKIEPSTLRQYYDQNTPRFQLPEQIRVEYVVLSLENMAAQGTVGEAEVKEAYESRLDRYRLPEERRASHILIRTDAGADKEKARAQAAAVLLEVQKSPERFAELAKQHSQDPGSAQAGGDLGYFARGAMVKSFEDRVFSAKENEISGLVESDFGFHIIKLTGVKPGQQRSLAEVRPEIEAELKRQSASRQFAEAAEAFSNLVYEQADSLQPAVERFHLKIQRSDWLPRQVEASALPSLGQLGNAKLLTSLFSDDSLTKKRNTEAVEIAPNTLLAARVVEHRPASNRPFESVSAEIQTVLRDQEAAALARKTGESKLAELRQAGDTGFPWLLVKNVSRLEPRQVPPTGLKAIFAADAAKLPAYVGADAGNGRYLLYKVMSVTQPETVDAARRSALQREYAAILGQEDVAAYLAGLRMRYKVDINKTVLESKER